MCITLPLPYLDSSLVPSAIVTCDPSHLFICFSMSEPQPQYSAFREASFGHAIFDIKNRTHAYYSWHRNQDGYAVEADRLWFYNRHWKQVDESPSS
ncbi:hypothetical protein SAY87_007347 [Trapa incisa]|uniref:Purple acid phosphatase C-terminal domain-containing protein n=1 Tax=Trapa incisa TaxID=236973 RepID=A0AAN7Q5K0_9MYRT|nr:hypothetical protein SAY87_007347 [Trapa incisa]